MVQLFLSPPASSFSVDRDVVRDAVKERISLLHRLESIIWSLLTSGGRYEGRIWLCNTISCIRTITPRDQCNLFIDLLRSKKSKQEVPAKILRMVFEKRPEKVGHIIAKKSYILENFFEGNPRRILQWFDNFATSNESGHKKGARAIAQFAFVNRDSCWEELEWKGKHGQSPAVVATKPHYFHNLDILKTVENFLEYVPDFWSSDELADSVKDGNILNLDTKYFVDQFIRLMYKENLEEIWVVIEDFLVEVDFSILSQHLLVLLDEQSLLTFLKSLGKLIHLTEKSCWLEILLSKYNEFMSLDDLLLLNAVISQGRQLLRLLNDEEHKEEKENFEELLRSAVAFGDAEHWALMKECLNLKEQERVKWLGLQSWTIHYYLSRDYTTRQLWESLFVSNGISFRKSNEYSLLQSDGFSKGFSSDSDGEKRARKGSYNKRKGDRKRKRGKKLDYLEDNVDEMLEFESFGGSSWFLSTDGYSCAWNTADLPEYLSRHYFLTWMNWVSSN